MTEKLRYKIIDPKGKIVFITAEEQTTLGTALAALATGDVEKLQQWVTAPVDTLTKRESVPEIDAFIKAAIRIQTLAAILHSGIVTRDHLQSELNKSSVAMWECLGAIEKEYPEYYRSLHEPIVDVKEPVS